MKTVRFLILLLLVALGVPLSSAQATGLPDYSIAVNGDSPAGYWRLGEATGAMTAADASGHGLTGQYRNVQTGIPGAVLRETDKAASFDAFMDTHNNDEVYVGPSGNLGSSGTPFTVELWAATSTISGDRALIGASVDGVVPDWFVAVTDDPGFEGRIRSMIVSGGVAKVHYGPEIPINDGEWHHVVATLDRSGVSEIYVDGVASGTSDVTQPAPVPPGPMQFDSIGLTIGDVAGYPQFVGQIDEPAVYATPLTASQVSLHHAAGDFSVPVYYTYDAAVAAGVDTPPTATEAGLPVCPDDVSGFDGYATAEEADAAGIEASLQANDEPECVPDRSQTEITLGGMPRHYWSPPDQNGYHYHGAETRRNLWQGLRINVEVSNPDVDHTPDEFSQEFVANRALMKRDRVTAHQDTLEVGWEESADAAERRYIYTEWSKRGERRPHHSRHAQYGIRDGKFISVRLRMCQDTDKTCADILWKRCPTPTQCRNRWELLERNDNMRCNGNCLYEEYLEVFSMQVNSPHPDLNDPNGKLEWHNSRLRVAPRDWRLFTEALDLGIRGGETPPNLSPYNSCWYPTPPYDWYYSFYVRKGMCF